MNTRGNSWLFSLILLAALPAACGGGGGGVTDEDGDGWLAPADCNDHDSNVNPGAREIPYNTVDEDCDGIAGNDTDFDGHDSAEAGGDDCNDSDRSIYPGAPEIPYDGIDQNCNGSADDADMDGDGRPAKMFGGDDCCDSGLELSLGCAGATAASIHPGAAEMVGNGIDENCDGSDTVAGTVEGDADGDGFAADSRPEGLDCDDTDATAHPGAPEICDGKDNDCNRLVDDRGIDFDDDLSDACFDCDDYDWRRSPDFEEAPYNDVDENCDGVVVNDVDGDGFWPIVDPANPDRPLDCDDANAQIHPSATEVCDHLDNDCEGGTDEDFIADHTDADGDGWLGGGAGQCPDCDDDPGDDPAECASCACGEVLCGGCARCRHPAAPEVSDGRDNDCDTWSDEIDADGDGYYTNGPSAPDCCDDGSESAVPGCSPATAWSINPGAEEILNDVIDQNCNGMDDDIDNDLDGDGHDGVSAGGDDCNDANAEAYPGHAEVCSDPADNDCSGLANEGCGPGTGEEVSVPSGFFTMGNDRSVWADQKPQHVVELSTFAIDKYEVTVADYRRCVLAGGCLPPPEIYSMLDERYFENQQKGLYPAIWINQDQAQRYCQWAGKRLPTEAEWEKAARGAGSATWAYPWGDLEYTTSPDGQTQVRKPVECQRANHVNLWTLEPCAGDTESVDSHPTGASIFGALNMAGNVAEWVADWYAEDWYATFVASPHPDPQGPGSGQFKVLRGGSFRDIDYLIEVSYRGNMHFTDSDLDTGFRCARSLP